MKGKNSMKTCWCRVKATTKWQRILRIISIGRRSILFYCVLHNNWKNSIKKWTDPTQRCKQHKTSHKIQRYWRILQRADKNEWELQTSSGPSGNFENGGNGGWKYLLPFGILLSLSDSPVALACHCCSILSSYQYGSILASWTVRIIENLLVCFAALNLKLFIFSCYIYML